MTCTVEAVQLQYCWLFVDSDGPSTQITIVGGDEIWDIREQELPQADNVIYCDARQMNDKTAVCVLEVYSYRVV